MPLTNTAIKNAKPREKPYKLFDGGGLYIEIKPNGSKLWRLQYRYDGRQKLLSMGIYPAVTLKQARQRRNDAKKLLADGIDPSAARKAEKAGAKNTFLAVAKEWYAKQEKTWRPSYRVKITRHIDKYLGPWLGNRPIADIEPPELLKTLRRIEARGHHETAHVAHQVAGRIFSYGIATGRCTRNPANDIRGALAPAKSGHFASIHDPARIGELLRAIDGYQGDFITGRALMLLPLVFVRPGELRHAVWQEFDLDEAMWRIPPERMKMARAHLVPLSRQAVEILRETYQLTGPDGFMFPSVRSQARPLSENTLNAALRRLGYQKDQMTAHGFRSMASTRLHEMGWSSQVIERQLAHVERNSVKAAYNHAEHLAERRRMMQAWADYLDGLKNGAEVVPIRGASLE